MSEAEHPGLDPPRRASMPWGDRAFLAALVVFATSCFLPWARETRVLGMAVMGWLLAALMVLSPAVAMLRLLRGRRR